MISPLVVRPVNHHDNVLFNESFFGLMETADFLDFDLSGSYLTLDSGFDSEANRVTIRGQGLIPVIHPIRRNTYSQKRLEEVFDEFEPYREMYKQRFTVERSYAWEDVYRKVAVRYERLQCTHLGFKYLAYTMTNLRWFIGKT